MARFFRTSDPTSLDFISELPANAIMQAINKTDQQIDTNQAASQAWQDKIMTLQALPEEQEKAKQLQQQYGDTFNTLSTQMAKDPANWRKYRADLTDASQKLKQDMFQGDWANISKNYSNYQSMLKDVDAVDKKGERVVPLSQRSALLNAASQAYKSSGANGQFSFNGIKPANYVDIPDYIKKSLGDKYAADGNVVSQDSNIGQYIVTDKTGKEVVDRGEVQNVIANLIRGNVPAMDYLHQAGQYGFGQPFTDKSGKDVPMYAPDANGNATTVLNPAHPFAPYLGLADRWAYNKSTQEKSMQENQYGLQDNSLKNKLTEMTEADKIADTNSLRDRGWKVEDRDIAAQNAKDLEDMKLRAAWELKNPGKPYPSAYSADGTFGNVYQETTQFLPKDQFTYNNILKGASTSTDPYEKANYNKILQTLDSRIAKGDFDPNFRLNDADLNAVLHDDISPNNPKYRGKLVPATTGNYTPDGISLNTPAHFELNAEGSRLVQAKQKFNDLATQNIDKIQEGNTRTDLWINAQSGSKVAQQGTVLGTQLLSQYARKGVDVAKSPDIITDPNNGWLAGAFVGTKKFDPQEVLDIVNKRSGQNYTMQDVFPVVGFKRGKDGTVDYTYSINRQLLDKNDVEMENKSFGKGSPDSFTMSYKSNAANQTIAGLDPTNKDPMINKVLKNFSNDTWNEVQNQFKEFIRYKPGEAPIAKTFKLNGDSNVSYTLQVLPNGDVFSNIKAKDPVTGKQVEKAKNYSAVTDANGNPIPNFEAAQIDVAQAAEDNRARIFEAQKKNNYYQENIK